MGSRRISSSTCEVYRDALPSALSRFKGRQPTIAAREVSFELSCADWMAQKNHTNCLDDSGARQSGARPKSSSIPLLMHVHGIGTKFLSPGNASWQPRLDFKSTNALPLLIEFLGPYSWHGAPDTRSVFTAPVASQQGINLWSIALPDHGARTKSRTDCKDIPRKIHTIR